MFSLDWSNCPPAVVTALLDNMKEAGENELAKTLRLLNKHWRRTISQQATCMKPAVLEKEDFPHFQKVNPYFFLWNLKDIL